MRKLTLGLAAILATLMLGGDALAQRRGPFVAANVKVGPVRAGFSIGGGRPAPTVTPAQLRQAQFERATFHSFHHEQQLNALNTFNYSNTLVSQNLSFHYVPQNLVFPSAIVAPSSYTYVSTPAPSTVQYIVQPPQQERVYIVQQPTPVPAADTALPDCPPALPAPVTSPCPAPAAITGGGVYYQTAPQRVIVRTYWH